MRDRNEKIVDLAREILGAERDPSPQTVEFPRPTHDMIPIKTACLTALAAAIGASSLTLLVQELSRPATRYEKFEIDALVYYAAQEKSVSATQVLEEIEKKLSLKQLERMTAYDYRRVRNYLWDKIKE